MDNIKLKITAKVDERVFKNGDTIELKLMPNMVNYIVGPNGSGKSTLLHAIRAYKDSIHEATPRDLQMNFARGHDLQTYKGVFDIEGLEYFEHVFTLDAVEDNPVSFEKASTATALIDGGGFWFMRKSRGEGSKMLLSRFLMNLQKITGASIDKESHKPINIPAKPSLIIIDEMDEGLDLHSQATFHHLMANMCNIFNATVICVCHNPICILYDWLGRVYPVLDMADRTYKYIQKYIDEQTGKHIMVVDTPEYNEYITWKEGNSKE